MTLRTVILLVFFFSARAGRSQAIVPDTAFLATAKMYTIQLYEQGIFGQSRINNGGVYLDYLSKDEEHPYFGVDDWVYGDLYYDDELYTNVPMFYDISQDHVITEHQLNGGKIELVSEKVKWFSLGEYRFVRINDDTTNVIPTGFSEVLYDGATKVYAHREKIFMQNIDNNIIIPRFDNRDRLYIKKDNAYFPVKSKGSVLQVLSDKKPEIKSFVSKHKVSFTVDREAAIVRMTEFYDSL